MNNMPRKGILAGAVLIGVAVVGYLATGMKSWTALIPAFAGAPILVASLIAREERMLKHGMHVAAVFGLLGFLAPAGRLVPKVAKGEVELNVATLAMFAMAVVCGVFLVLCIQSFKAARRARRTD